MDKAMTRLKKGESGIITELLHEGAMRRRLTDIGFAVGAEVTCIGHAPLCDPIAYNVKGSVIALRRCDTDKIMIGE